MLPLESKTINIVDAVSLYLKALRSEKINSVQRETNQSLNKEEIEKIEKSTYRVYKSELMSLRNFIFDQKPEARNIEDISSGDLIEFINRHDKASQSTRAFTYSVLNGFFRFLIDYKYTFHQPMVGIKRPPIDNHKNIKPLNEDEQAALLEFCTRDSPWPEREKAIVYLLMCCGLTRDELLRATWDKISTARGVIYIENGNKSRTLALDSETIKSLDELWYSQRAKGWFTNYVISNSKGEKISAELINKVLKKMEKHLCFAINPKRLRQTFAYNLVKTDVDFSELGYAMGITDTAAERLKISLKRVDYTRTNQ